MTAASDHNHLVLRGGAPPTSGTAWVRLAWKDTLESAVEQVCLGQGLGRHVKWTTGKNLAK